MSQQDKKPIVVGNWKMYKTLAETTQYIHALKPLIVNSPALAWLAVPFTSIDTAVKAAAHSSILIGAQNMNDATEGAFTGEIAGKMIRDAGGQFVILGHSERRRFFHESNATINKKILRACRDGLKTILCIGENNVERDEGRVNEILGGQLVECLRDIPDSYFSELLIAYEPLWAIGTSSPATPEQADEAHAFCRGWLREHKGDDSANKIALLYGGSVTTQNAQDLLNQPHIDGLLVGGASLNPATFGQIVNSMNSNEKVNSL